MSNNFEDREKKINLLLSWQRENSIPFIVNSIKDKDPFVRAEALLILSNNANKELYFHIIPSLQDEDHHVRYSAADALGRMGCKDSVNSLIEAFNNNSEFVQCKIIDSLGKINSEESVDFLILKLYNENKIIRDEVILALESMIEYTICTKKLTQFFEEDNSREETFHQLHKMLQISQKFKDTFSC